MATQSGGGVSITGGSITGITELAIEDGDTGASSAAAAFANFKRHFEGAHQHQQLGTWRCLETGCL
jgi:hypothetical protein